MAYSKKNIIKAIKDAKGIISVAAKSLGCERQTIYNRMSKDEDIQEAMRVARDSMIDTAENALHNLITNDEHRDHYKATRYYLSTQGKKRGYIEKSEVHNINENTHEFLNDLFPEFREDDED